MYFYDNLIILLYINRSNSPESGISTSHLSIPDAEFADEVDAIDGEFDEPLPALGTAKALYAFEGIFVHIIDALY